MYTVYNELKNEVNKRLAKCKSNVLLLNDVNAFLSEVKTENQEMQSLINDVEYVHNNLDVDYSMFQSDFMKAHLKSINEYNTYISLSVLNLDEVTHDVIDVLSISENSCVVGGFIRSSLMGTKTKDVDFVTDIPMKELNALFVKRGFIVKNVGESFLVTVVSKDGMSFEIANFRKDRDNSGGEIGTMLEDAMRRDFTVNALYYNLKTKTIIDPNRQGISDLEKGVLRFIGNAEERIKEDSNRVFRFYRFLSKGFTANNSCLKAVRRNFEQSVKNTSADRIMKEIERML